MSESKKIKRQKAKAEMKMRRWAGRRVMALAIGLIVCSAALVFAARAYNWRSPEIVGRVKPAAAEPILQGQPATRGRLHNRLSLQPEASRVNRRLGQRYKSAGREKSMLVGTLTIGGQSQPVRIFRTQEDDGEQVEIALGGGQASLRWSSKEGAKSQGDRATGDERKIIERLTLDSPDQFILAQVRGASYSTVGRDVIPAEEANNENYSGPVWDVVRVDESLTDSPEKPQSRWRLYYINSSTDLIERVVSSEDGEPILAEFSDWVERGGEMLPSRITWKRSDQVVMELVIHNATFDRAQ